VGWLPRSCLAPTLPACPCWLTLLPSLATAAQVLVVTLLNVLAPLLDVMLLCSFVFLVFGLIGLQVFAGALRFRWAPHPASQRPSQRLCWQRRCARCPAACSW
jgi:hypothetical protein